MTVLTNGAPPGRHRTPKPPLPARAFRWFWRDAVIVLVLMVIAGLVHGLQMSVTPGLMTTDDEGTYVAQAWAILNFGELAHYTYWYDHPPLGWIQMAGWAWMTDAFDRYDSAIAVGREVMLVAKLASVAILYPLARRLGMNRFFAIGAVALFALSPLALHYQRLTFLDNITIPWVLAAFFLAASPLSRLSASIGSALCFGVAVLTKETILVVLPALLWQLWQSSHPRTRRMNFWVWVSTLGLVCLFYPLLAFIKNELLPGPGHVDMLYAIKWQLFDRASSGSVFDPTSAAHVIARSWADLDPWLIALAVVMTLPAFFSRNLRPVAAAFAIQIAVMLRPGGYLPQPYLIALVPFAALVVAGTVSALWESGLFNRFHHLRRQIPRTGYSYAQALVQAPALAMVVAIFLAVAPSWGPKLDSLMSDDRTESFRQAIEWVETNVPARQGDGDPVRLVVSDSMWVDLKERGYEPDWYFKVDLDPGVKSSYPNGWEDVAYVIYTNEMNELAKAPESEADMATTLAARENGRLVAKFGSLSETIWIYEVNPPNTG